MPTTVEAASIASGASSSPEPASTTAPCPRPFALNGSVTSERPSSAAPRALLPVVTASVASSRSDSIRALHHFSSQAPPLCRISSALPASRENSTAKPAFGASAPTWLAVRPRIDSKCDSDANSRDAVSSTDSRWLSRVIRVSARFVITRSARNTASESTASETHAPIQLATAKPSACTCGSTKRCTTHAKAPTGTTPPRK